ncbi:MAG: DUF3566 domain-containing protein [Gordonia sp. (in: high G+C Gram-positive bacteria)]|uniref:DUF3566 domain-containing protein n=1 Tax=Gordonia sp. (in: high G+C Gram-positive bacteria) TaxID=84139 RepID=UPI0039E3B1AF
MTKANEPEDPKADKAASDRGNVVPPWTRAETSASTGMTAGDLAKKAAQASGQQGPSQQSPSSAPTKASPAAKAAPAKAAPAKAAPAKTGPAPAPAKAAPAPVKNAGPKPPPPQGPASQGPPPSGGSSNGPMVKVNPAPPVRPSGAPPVSKPAPATVKAAAVTPDKDERPNLDAIHKASTEDAERAAVKHIPATPIGTPLRAAVQVRRVDPWSVFKISGVLSVAGFLIWMIAIAVLYGILGGMGVWDQINSSFGTLVSADGSGGDGHLISTGQVFGFAALFGVFAAIVVTALSTILAYIYNVAADTVGGVEVTLADLD